MLLGAYMTAIREHGHALLAYFDHISMCFPSILIFLLFADIVYKVCSNSVQCNFSGLLPEPR
jgi:hypothetical protein